MHRKENKRTEKRNELQSLYPQAKLFNSDLCLLNAVGET